MIISKFFGISLFTPEAYVRQDFIYVQTSKYYQKYENNLIQQLKVNFYTSCDKIQSFFKF